MTSSAHSNREKTTFGSTAWIAIAVFFVLLGVSWISGAWAVNSTAIDEIQNDLQSELDHGFTFSVFYIIFLLVMLAAFMAVAIARHQEREMLFFSLGATIVSFVLTMLFISTASFDYITTEQTILVEEIGYLNGSVTYNVAVTQSSESVNVIPFDDALRMSLSLLFGGIALFNGLYSILIMTYFSKNGKIGI